MCSIITVNKETLSLRKLEKYLLRESTVNNDGMSLLLQSETGELTALKTFDLNTIMVLLETTDWQRMWMHMRAATQGEVTLRNTHGWMTSNGTTIMHNGILFDKDSYKFNVDSELIVDWVETCGIELTLELLLTENYANVFIIENLGDYYVSRTKSGSLFTDGKGNFATNQIGRINQAVKPGYQRKFSSGFSVNPGRVRDFLDYEDHFYEMGYYSDGYYSSYDKKTGRMRHVPKHMLDTQVKLPSSRFNDSGKVNGLKPNLEKDNSVLMEEINKDIKLGWDTVHDDDDFSDEELTEYEKFKRKVG